jgi:hypothetical protein
LNLSACGLEIDKKLDEVVIAPPTKTPRGERAHAVGAHVAEGHGHWLIVSHETKAVSEG